MMWMGKVSAWGAIVMAAMFAVNAYLRFAMGVAEWAYIAAALGLAIGGYRTLRKMSGGLRLLAGAWGFAAGLLALPFMAPMPSPDASVHDSYYVVGSPLSIGLVLIALVGLALTVLHKER